MRNLYLLPTLFIFIFNSCSVGPLISEGEIFKNLTQITFDDGDNFSPVVSKDGKKLLFVSKRDGDYNIYLKNNPLDRADVKKTDHKGSDINPCFSSDGSKFCFSSDRNGNFDIFVMDVERGFAATQITSSENDDALPDWSPNGEIIAFSQYSRTDREWYIWTKNLTNGQITQICKGISPIFSADGKRLFYKRAAKNYYQLWQIDLDGENNTQLTSGDDWGIGSYTLNTDGKKVLYSTVKSRSFSITRSNDGMDLWVLNIENGDQIQITTHKGSDFDPAWASTNDIFFASDRMGKINIWSFKANF